jgi:hypothetical protein
MSWDTVVKDGPWLFYCDAMKNWRWVLHDADTCLIAKSMTGFRYFSDCEDDAMGYGYVPRRARITAANPG